MNIELPVINMEIKKNHAEFINLVNSSYLRRLTEIADDIAEHRNERPIILLSGPSGSGKTTTAMMIEKILDENGVETHTLSMDNYFCPLSDEEKRLLAEGQIDLESPSRVDSKFLSSQLEAIESCEPVELPRYDFKSSARVKTGRFFQRRPGELVILEGIHALNPEVITLPDEKSAKVYVSVRTRITDGDITLHPSKIRLMRRLVRDSKFRRRSFRETLMMFPSVEEGENKYIMPYKYRSTYDVDTFMAYEVCAYREPLLDGLLQFGEAADLADALTVLSDAVPLSAENITPDSLICEFIGNGQFMY